MNYTREISCGKRAAKKQTRDCELDWPMMDSPSVLFRNMFFVTTFSPKTILTHNISPTLFSRMLTQHELDLFYDTLVGFIQFSGGNTGFGLIDIDI